MKPARTSSRAREKSNPGRRKESSAAEEFARLSGEQSYGAIRALEATTGKLEWQFKLLAPAWVPVLSTAGGLVFSGSDEGNFFALDAETGKPLWNIQLGHSARSNPISYEVDGKQYIFETAGNTYIAFTLP